VSRRIQALERELGVRLFDRTTRHVSLTTAGQAFLNTVQDSLARLDGGVRALRRAQGLQDTLVVGYVEYANLPFVPTVLQRFAAAWPDVRIEQRELAPERQIDLVAQGEIDVAFVGLPGGLRVDGLGALPIASARWKLAMSTGHPLAQATEVHIADLANERLVLFPRYANPTLYDWIRRCLVEAGQEPRIVQEPTQLHTALSLVAAGAGVMPTTFFIEPHLRADVGVRPLAGFGPGARISAVYRKADLSPTLSDFLGLVRRVLRDGELSADVSAQSVRLRP
jgi:DNA-binding transcriptional LysR family regulator